VIFAAKYTHVIALDCNWEYFTTIYHS